MRTFALAVPFALVMLGAVSVGVYGQTPRANGPFGGLFGGGAGGFSQQLTLNAALAAGYTQSGLTSTDTTGGSGDVRSIRSSSFQQASAGLGYSLSRSRVGFSASTGTSASYYPRFQDRFLLTGYGSAGGDLQLWKGMRVSVSESVTYRPIYFLNTLSALVDPTSQLATDPSLLGIDPALYGGARNERVLTSWTAGAIRQDLSLTSRVSLSLSYAYARSQSSRGDRNLSTQNGLGRLQIGLAKGLSLRLGYGRSVGSYGGANRQRVAREHIDAGLDFNRALSLTRSLTLSFGSGLTAVKYDARKRYVLAGHIRLNRHIGRTWNAGLAYARGVHVLDTFRQPVISSSLRANVGGLLTQRVQFHSTAGVSTGNIGFGQVGNGFGGIYGTTGLNVGLLRAVGLGLDYSYYRQRFDNSVQLPFGLLRRIDRQSIRLHVNVWIPLISRGRSRYASR
jgi:hypothetical protein